MLSTKTGIYVQERPGTIRAEQVRLSGTCRRGVYILDYKEKERTRVLVRDITNAPEVDPDQRLTRQTLSVLLFA